MVSKKITNMVDLKAYLRYIIEPYPWKFMGFIILAMIIPKIYELSNTFWIGKIDASALAITEQFEFLAVSIEIINETIPFGILALISQNFMNRERVMAILKSGILLQIFFSTIFMLIVIFFTPQFVSTIGTPAEIVSLTKQYLILKSIALPFDSVALLALISIKSMQKGKEALYIVIFSVILNMVLDLFLISNMSFSLHLGIKGVAIGYVISKIALAIFSLTFIFHILNIKVLDLRKNDYFNQIKPIFRIGGFTGLDSLVRNFGYILTLMILNLIGTNAFGGYGLAMTLMWTAIIPMLAIAEGTNVAVGNFFGQKRYTDIDRILQTSIVLSVGTMIIIGIGGSLFWRNLSAVMNMNPEIVNYSTQAFWWLIIPYTLFAISTVTRCLFFGTGQTKYILYTSLLANVLVVMPFVVLVRNNVLEATFTNVMLQFVIVFVADLIIVLTFAKGLRKDIHFIGGVHFE